MTPTPFRRFAFPLLGFLSIGLLLPACRKNASTTVTPAEHASVAASAAEPGTPPAKGVVSLDKIPGTWIRTDGGYRLVIGAIGDGGHTKAGYFNPNPINVAWARVRFEGPEIKVDLELRDENYPGCLYKLTYDQSRDVLVGTYFQAQLQETYQIEFARQS